MSSLMRLSEDADLRAIAGTAYVFLSPNHHMIHDQFSAVGFRGQLFYPQVQHRGKSG